MAPPVSKQLIPHCRLSSQIVIEAVLFTAAAYTPFPVALVLVLIAIAVPIYCFVQTASSPHGETPLSPGSEDEEMPPFLVGVVITVLTLVVLRIRYHAPLDWLFE